MILSQLKPFPLSRFFAPPQLSSAAKSFFLRHKTLNFHVHKDNIKLYSRIKKGLELLEKTEDSNGIMPRTQ